MKVWILFKCSLGRESVLNAFKSKIFPLKPTQGKRIKIITPNQMFQRLQ